MHKGLQQEFGRRNVTMTSKKVINVQGKSGPIDVAPAKALYKPANEWKVKKPVNQFHNNQNAQDAARFLRLHTDEKGVDIRKQVARTQGQKAGQSGRVIAANVARQNKIPLPKEARRMLH